MAPALLDRAAMQRKKVWIAATVVIVVSVVVGFWLHGGSRASAVNPSQPPVTRPGVVPPRADEWRGSVDPVGSLVLEGQVLDHADRPVGGATVVIDSQPQRTVTTEDDGSFSVDGLTARDYEVTASHTSGVAGPVTARLSTYSDPVVLRLVSPGQVTVRVIDAATREPIGNAQVEVRAPIVAEASTGDDGIANLSPVVRGHWNVVAHAANHARAHGAVIIGDSPASLTLTMETGFTVHGRVVDESGAPVPSARVWALSSSDWTDGVSPERDGTTSADDGSFTLTGLAMGTYRLWARARGFAPGSSAAITVGPRAEVTITLAAAATLRGRVVYMDGRPAASAVVHAFLANDTATTHTADDGSFLMTDLPRTKLKVLGRTDDASCWSVPVDLTGGSGEVTLRLDLSAFVAGLVVDSAGDPIEAAQIDIELVEPGSRFVRSELTDGAGQFRIGGLPEGDYKIVATRPGIDPSSAQEPVRAHTGTSVRIVLGSPGALKARVTFQDGSSPELITARLGEGNQGRAFTDGKIQISAVAPGQYDLRIEGAEIVPRDAVRVTVAENRETDLGTIVVERGRNVDGVVVDRNGAPVAGAEIVAAPALLGTGIAADSGTRAPALQSEIKRATSNASGTFQLRGLAATPLTVVASHSAIGRSQPETLTPSATGPLRLILNATGSIDGTMTLNGGPVPGMVAAQPHVSPLAMSVVVAGKDGDFHFDRLAPGIYSVSAIAGDPLSGAPFTPARVEVASGSPTRITLAAARGDRTLRVTTKERSVVFATTEPLQPVHAYDLVTRLGTQTNGHWALAASNVGLAVFTKLAAADYTVCAVSLDQPISDLPAMLELLSRRGADLAVRCKTITARDTSVSVGAS